MISENLSQNSIGTISSENSGTLRYSLALENRMIALKEEFKAEGLLLPTAQLEQEFREIYREFSALMDKNQSLSFTILEDRSYEIVVTTRSADEIFRLSLKLSHGLSKMIGTRVVDGRAQSVFANDILGNPKHLFVGCARRR